MRYSVILLCLFYHCACFAEETVTEHNKALLKGHLARIKSSPETDDVAVGLLEFALETLPDNERLVDLGPLYQSHLAQMTRRKSLRKYRSLSKHPQIENLTKIPNHFQKGGGGYTPPDYFDRARDAVHSAISNNSMVRQLMTNPIQEKYKKLMGKYFQSGDVDLSNLEKLLTLVTNDKKGTLTKEQIANLSGLYSTESARRQKLCRYVMNQKWEDLHLYSDLKSALRDKWTGEGVKTVDHSGLYTPPERQKEAECFAEALVAEMTKADGAKENPYSVDYAYSLFQTYDTLGYAPLRSGEKFKVKLERSPGVRDAREAVQLLSSYPVPKKGDWHLKPEQNFDTDDLGAFWKDKEARGIEDHRFFGHGALFPGDKRPESFEACLALPFDKLELLAASGLVSSLNGGATFAALITSDKRRLEDLQEGWLRPMPDGEMGHAINIVGQGYDTDPFSGKRLLYFKVRDTLTNGTIFRKVAAADLIPLLNGLILVNKVSPMRAQF